MKNFLNMVIAIVVAFIIFTVVAGVVAATLTSLANSETNLSAGTTMFIGLLSEIIKWGAAIFAGIRTYKFFKNKSQIKTN